MNTLTELRSSIQEIDSKIIQLIEERNGVARKIAQYKKEHNLPIFDPKREEEILNALPKNLQSLWMELMNISKQEQEIVLQQK